MKTIHRLILGIGLITSTLFSSCIKEQEAFDWEAQYELEKPLISSYAATNLVNAIQDPTTGIYFERTEIAATNAYEYKIVNGQIEAPTIKVRYTGKLFNGTVFDENQTEAGYQISLARVIQAWQIAFLPKLIGSSEVGGLTTSGLQAGDVIKIVTPSYLAYANSSSGQVPANSPLFFEIEVISVTAPTGSSN